MVCNAAKHACLWTVGENFANFEFFELEVTAIYTNPVSRPLLVIIPEKLSA